MRCILLVAAVLLLAPADRDPRCNTLARYAEAMPQGANCSGSEAWPEFRARRKPKRKP